MSKSQTPSSTYDPLSRHLESFQNRVLSYSRVVTEIMELRAIQVRRLLKDLVDSPVEAPESSMVCRLAAASLLQTEVKHRLRNDGQSLLPFNIHDYTEAVAFAKIREPEYARLETITDEDGNTVTVEKKSGRKGDSFEKVKQYMLDNLDTFNKEVKVKDVANAIESEKGVPYATALQYVYKCRRLRKQHEI